MKKIKSKKLSPNAQSSEKDFFDSMRKLGNRNGIKIAHGSNGKISHYYEIGTSSTSLQNGVKQLKISFSSVEQDNNELLHFLLKKAE